MGPERADAMTFKPRQAKDKARSEAARISYEPQEQGQENADVGM